MSAISAPALNLLDTFLSFRFKKPLYAWPTLTKDRFSSVSHYILEFRKLGRQQKTTMVFKSLNGLTSAYLSDVFINRSDATNYSLRDSVNKLVIPIPFFWKTVLAMVVRCGALIWCLNY